MDRDGGPARPRPPRNEELGCDLGQGFFFYKPLTEAAIDELAAFKPGRPWPCVGADRLRARPGPDGLAAEREALGPDRDLGGR